MSCGREGWGSAICLPKTSCRSSVSLATKCLLRDIGYTPGTCKKSWKSSVKENRYLALAFNRWKIKRTKVDLEFRYQASERLSLTADVVGKRCLTTATPHCVWSLIRGKDQCIQCLHSDRCLPDMPKCFRLSKNGKPHEITDFLKSKQKKNLLLVKLSHESDIMHYRKVCILPLRKPCWTLNNINVIKTSCIYLSSCLPFPL